MKIQFWVLVFLLFSGIQVSAETSEDISSKVVVYGHTGCPWTNKALAYLDKRDVEYILMDVKNDDDANRDFYARGYKKIPQVIVAGEDEVTGWRRGELTKALIKHGILID